MLRVRRGSDLLPVVLPCQLVRGARAPASRRVNVLGTRRPIKTAVRLRSSIRVLAGCLLAVLVAAAPAARAEDDAAAIDKVVKLNKRAVDEYQNLNFEKARKLLEDALTACSRSGLDNHPVAARTHVHLGVVLFAGLKDKDAATGEFKKAAQIQSDVKLDTALATPEIQEVFDQAVGGGAGGAGAAPSEDAITHEAITRAQQGKSIAVNATLESSVKATKMVLKFSADGSDDFGKRDMKEESPGNWMGEIPSSATEGAKVSYYIEALGDDDQVLARKGSATEPMVVSLRGPGGSALVPPKKKAPAPAPKKEETEAPSWFFALGLGTGFGWTTGTGEINSQDHVNPTGFAWSRLGQISPQVGYFVSPNLMLSVEFRLQLVTGATAFYSTTGECGSGGTCSPASYAAAGFAKASWLFDMDDLHPFVGGMLGGGTIRHITEFKSEPHCGSNMTSTCVDTVASGPIFVGGTAGILYNITPGFALMGEVNAVLGFTKFTFNLDFNAGVAVEY